METLKFKTNIMCTGCLSKVGPELDDKFGKDNWQIDLANAQKTLTVSAPSNKQEVIDTVQKAGYVASELV